MKTIDQQIECVERELRFRRRIYAGRVQAGAMTMEEKAHEIETMESILELLHEIRRGLHPELPFGGFG